MLIFFQTAMEVMQFSKEEVREVLRLLAGILQLGNIEFITAGGAQVSFKTGKIVASHLGFFPDRRLTPKIFTRWPLTGKVF